MNFYNYGEPADTGLRFTVETRLDTLPEAVKPTMNRFAAKDCGGNHIGEITVKQPIDKELAVFLKQKSGVRYKQREEAFVIRPEGENIAIYCNDRAGMINGLMTFLRLLDDDFRFNYSYIWDWPESSCRGVKIFTPHRNEIGDFKALVDMMMYFRHNTLMMEVGGAMEYKRHPEINEGWEVYASVLSEYSGKAREVQENRYPWRKNAIHVDNGGGSYLTQEEVKELIAYANERGISVIPEVPSSSHCDYMLIRHPELAERPEDPYPDTFCPSNPASYELLFDILDEVIEVFKPEVINIGHDEFYSINVCDRCRKRLMEAYDIFAEDVIKIHDYLAAKKVKTMLWCDKLMNVLTENGANFGGALNMVYFQWNTKGKLLGIIPPVWPARNKLPKDIICLNWFWSFGEKYDGEIKDFPALFGNFRGEQMTGYRKRCGSNIHGGMCSNWAATKPVYLQRNRIYFSMAYNEVLFWNGDYDDNDDGQFEQTCKSVFEELQRYKYVRPNPGDNRYIEVVHTTDRTHWYHEFVDGEFAFGQKYEDNYYLGSYDIEYADGTCEHSRIYLGEHISSEDLPWFGGSVAEEGSSANPGERTARIHNKLCEVAYTTVPQHIDGKIYYKYLLENPRPDKKIKNVTFTPAENAEWQVDIRQIKF